MDSKKRKGCKVWVNVPVEIGGKILPSLQFRVTIISGRQRSNGYYYLTELGEYAETDIYENCGTARNHSYDDAVNNVFFMKHVKNA